MKPFQMKILSLLLLTSLITRSTSSCVTLDSTYGEDSATCEGESFQLDKTNLPVEITAQTGTSVSFKISQDFVDSVVSKFAVHYHSGITDVECAVEDDAPVDFVTEEYTAVCFEGKASVIVYSYLCNYVGEEECDYCQPPEGDATDYYQVTFILDCSENCDGTPTPSPTATPPSGTNGDPHFKTWKQEHFEYHGQCDMILAQDLNFADGLGLDVQIRTKLVRFWSYIKSVAIRIGDDIIEIQGAAEYDDLSTANYWVNFEYQGELNTLGGFPVSLRLHEINERKRWFTIDLSSKYPGVKIVVAAWREFIRIDFMNHSEEAFGNVVGMLGNYSTGKTLARDGVTVVDDFYELGNEWQLLPADHMLFHNTESPQFPKKCLEPEDPVGERRRRLAESNITEKQAEAACASIRDPLDRKDCIYDIVATQDLEMVGAY